jgi:hypothetical protein
MTLISPNGLRSIVLRDTANFNNKQQAFPAKDPAEELNYTVDFSKVIENNSPLSNVDFGSLCGDDSLVVLDGPQCSGQTVTMRIVGGTAGFTGTINMLASFEDGQYYSASVLLPVIQKIPNWFAVPWSFSQATAINSSNFPFFF